MKKTRVQGWDVSLNHAGFVELVDGELRRFVAFNDTAGVAAKLGRKHGVRLPKPDTKDPHLAGAYRLWAIDAIITRAVINETRRPHFVGIEDYAFGASHRAHGKGEVGGIARMICLHKSIPFRLHDPLSVKMFTAHDGTASKDDMVDAVERRWGVDFKRYTAGKDSSATEDLSDAYAVAQLVWTEVQLRRGDLKLSDLVEKEVRVFNRVTKSQPINLLDRDWVSLSAIGGGE